MQVGTKVRVKDTAAKRAGQTGTIVALKRTAPTGLTWDEVKARPKNAAEIRFDDGTTSWALFTLTTLESVDA